MAINLSWQQVALFAVIIIVLAVSIIFSLYLGYKNEQNKKKEDKKPNPFMWIVLGFAVCIMLLVALMMAGIEFTMWHATGMFAIMVMMFIQYKKTLDKFTPKAYDELIERSDEINYDKYRAELYKGMGRWGKTRRLYKITESKNPKGSLFDAYANILTLTTAGTIYNKINIFDETLLESVPDPSTQKIEEIFGEETARQFDLERDAFLSEYNLKDDAINERKEQEKEKV